EALLPLSCSSIIILIASGQSSNPLGHARAPDSIKHLVKIWPFRTSAASPLGDEKIFIRETVPLNPSENNNSTVNSWSETFKISSILFPNFFIHYSKGFTLPGFTQSCAFIQASKIWSLFCSLHILKRFSGL